VIDANNGLPICKVCGGRWPHAESLACEDHLRDEERRRSSFAGKEVVSEPEAGITITALHLTPEAQQRLCTDGARIKEYNAVEQIERAWGSARGLTPLSAPCDCGSTDSVNADGECVTCAFQSRLVQLGDWNQPHALSAEADAVRELCRQGIAVGPQRLRALLDAHANDLTDMNRCVSQVEEVYVHIAGLSKWNTDPIHIKQAHDDAVDKAEREGREYVLAQFDELVSRQDFDLMDVDEVKRVIAAVRGRS
jgi:hypothetical protein